MIMCVQCGEEPASYATGFRFCSVKCQLLNQQLGPASMFTGPVQGRLHTVLDELADLTKEAKDICTARTTTYSEKHFDRIEADYTQVGKAWAGVLSKHLRTEIKAIPAHVCCLMMAEMKLLRASVSGYHRDNYLDALNYIAFASKFQRMAETQRTNASEERSGSVLSGTNRPTGAEGSSAAAIQPRPGSSLSEAATCGHDAGSVADRPQHHG